MNSIDLPCRALITGGSGFIGTHLLKALRRAGAQCAVIDRMGPSPAALSVERSEADSACLFFQVDLRDSAAVKACLDSFRPTLVFHLAAFKERTADFGAFQKAVEINVMGSLNLFSAARECEEITSIVVLGSAEEYGPVPTPFRESNRESPVSAYSFSKTCLSHLCQVMHRLYGIPVVVLRPTLAYGPGQDIDMFLPALMKAILADEPFPMTPGEQTRDYLYIDDLVQALLLAAHSPTFHGIILNIGSGVSVPIGDLARQVESLLGKSGLVRLGALPYRPGELMSYEVDLGAARQLLGWAPRVDLDEGLARTIAWFRGRPG